MGISVAQSGGGLSDGETTPVPDDRRCAPCDWCIQHPTRPCPACNVRRRRAVRLVERDGLSVTDVARRMRLPRARVERLLEQEADRRMLTQLHQAHVDNASLRQLFRARRRADPSLTAAEIGRRIGTSAIQVERWLGLVATAPKTDPRGRTYPGRILSEISVDTAGRLARALGYAPCEIDGC
jgi:hypothetical protein